jgi:hypothetical protein
VVGKGGMRVRTFVHRIFIPAFLNPLIIFTVAFTTPLPAFALGLRPGSRKKSTNISISQISVTRIKLNPEERGEILCMSIITSADLDTSMVIFVRLPWQGIVYMPVEMVGSRAERVRSQIPDVDLIQLDTQTSA